MEGWRRLHGKSKARTFHYTLGRTRSTLRELGTVRLDIRDCGTPTPSSLGITVKPGVDVQVEFNATE